MDGGGIWCLGNGEVFGAVLDVFGLGGGAGHVCAICVSQVGFRVRFLCACQPLLIVRSFE